MKDASISRIRTINCHLLSREFPAASNKSLPAAGNFNSQPNHGAAVFFSNRREPSAYAAIWGLYGPYDQLLVNQAYIHNNIGIVTLPATGTYTLGVVGFQLLRMAGGERELALEGRSVLVLDRGNPRDATSWAAAGMLAPQSEADAPSSFFDLCLASACEADSPLGFDRTFGQSSFECERHRAMEWGDGDFAC